MNQKKQVRGPSLRQAEARGVGRGLKSGSEPGSCPPPDPPAPGAYYLLGAVPLETSYLIPREVLSASRKREIRIGYRIQARCAWVSWATPPLAATMASPNTCQALAKHATWPLSGAIPTTALCPFYR